jgi:hypothetical protein
MAGHTYKQLFAIGITVTLLAVTSWGGERTWIDTTGRERQAPVQPGDATSCHAL